MPYAQPIKTLAEALTVRPVSQNWHIGQAKIDGRLNTFFAKTSAELLFKYRAARQTSLMQQFHGGQRVRYQRPGEKLHESRVYTIGMRGRQQDGTPVAWLNGLPGCVPLERLHPVLQHASGRTND